MDNIKVSLTITLPGGVMYSKEECLKTTQKIVKVTSKKNGKTFSKRVLTTEKDPSKFERSTLKIIGGETLSIEVPKCRPASQTINMTREAYNYMTSKVCPEWFKNHSKWLKLKPLERLEEHLKTTSAHFGGVIESYKIFED